MSDTLVLDAITKVYNKGLANEVRVLQGASITVARGEVVALVAPSGAGKSTLLHIAGLLDTPDAGRVLIDGADMAGPRGAARLAAVAAGGPLSLLSEPVPTTRSVMPDPDLSVGLIARRSAMQELLPQRTAP